MSQQLKYYAVIQSAGMHGQGATVRPIYTTLNLTRARAMADKATRNFRRDMAPHGGTSGRYVVVEAYTCRPSWQGMDADSEPRVYDPGRP